jgi:hypothetical protein
MLERIFERTLAGKVEADHIQLTNSGLRKKILES